VNHFVGESAPLVPWREIATSASLQPKLIHHTL